MIYLDNAATTIKKPDAVYDAVLDAMKHCGNSGRGASDASLIICYVDNKFLHI